MPPPPPRLAIVFSAVAVLSLCLSSSSPAGVASAQETRSYAGPGGLLEDPCPPERRPASGCLRGNVSLAQPPSSRLELFEGFDVPGRNELEFLPAEMVKRLFPASNTDIVRLFTQRTGAEQEEVQIVGGGGAAAAAVGLGGDVVFRGHSESTMSFVTNVSAEPGALSCAGAGEFQAANLLVTQQNLEDDPTRYASWVAKAIAYLQKQKWPYEHDHGHGCHNEWHIDGPAAQKHITLVPGTLHAKIVATGIYAEAELHIEARVPTFIRGCDHILFFCFCSTICNGWVTFNSNIKTTVTFEPVLDKSTHTVQIKVVNPVVQISNPTYQGCHASWIVRWFTNWKADVSSALQQALQQEATNLAKDYGLPQTFKLYNNTYGTYCIDSYVLTPSTSITVASQAIVTATVTEPKYNQKVNVSYVPNKASAAMAPPGTWTIPPVTPKSQPLLAGLRMSSTLLSGLMWAADVTGAVNVTYNATVKDAKLNFRLFYSAPVTGVPEDGLLSLYVADGQVNVSCGCAPTKDDANDCGGPGTGKSMFLRDQLLSVGFKVVTGKGTVQATQLDGDPAAEVQVTSLNTSETKVHVIEPQVPVAPAVTDAIVKTAIRHLSPVLNAYLRTHPLPVPPKVAPLFPHPTLQLIHQPGCCDGQHGYIELQEHCQCPTSDELDISRSVGGGIAPVWQTCGFSCKTSSTSSLFDVMAESNVASDGAVARNSSYSQPMLGDDGSSIYVAWYTNSGCQLQTPGTDMLIEFLLEDTNGVCTLEPGSNQDVTYYYSTYRNKDAGTIDVHAHCSSKSCTQCGLWETVKPEVCQDTHMSLDPEIHLAQEGQGSVVVTTKPCLSFGNVSVENNKPIDSTTGSSSSLRVPADSADAGAWVFQEFYAPADSCDVKHMQRGGSTVMGPFGSCVMSASSGLWMGISNPLPSSILGVRRTETVVQVRFGCNESTCVSTGCESLFNITLNKCDVLPKGVGAVNLVPLSGLAPCVDAPVPEIPSVWPTIIIATASAISLIALIICCVTPCGKRLLRRTRVVVHLSSRFFRKFDVCCKPVSLFCIDVGRVAKKVFGVLFVFFAFCFRVTAKFIRENRHYVGFPFIPLARSDWVRVVVLVLLAGMMTYLGWAWNGLNPFSIFETHTLHTLGIPGGDLEPQKFEDTFNNWHGWGSALCYGTGAFLLLIALLRFVLKDVPFADPVSDDTSSYKSIPSSASKVISALDSVSVSSAINMDTTPRHLRAWRITAAASCSVVIPMLIAQMFTPAFVLDFRDMLKVNGNATQFFRRNPDFVVYLNDILGISLTSVTMSFLSTEFLFIVQPLPVAVSSMTAVFMGLWGILARRGLVRWPQTIIDQGAKIQPAGVLHTRALLQRAQLYGSIMLLLIPVACILPMIGVYQAFEMPPFWAVAWLLHWIVCFILHFHVWKVMHSLQVHLKKGDAENRPPGISLLINAALNILGEILFVTYLCYSLKDKAVGIGFASSVLVTSFVSVSGFVFLLLMHAGQSVQADTRVAVRPRRLRAGSQVGSVSRASFRENKLINDERAPLLDGATDTGTVFSDSEYSSHDDYFTDEDDNRTIGRQPGQAPIATSSSRFSSYQQGAKPNANNERSTFRGDAITAASSLPDAPVPSLKEKIQLKMRPVTDFVLENRERADPHRYGKRPGLRRFCLIVGVLPALYIVGYQWIQRASTTAREQVNRELEALPTHVSLPDNKNGGTMFTAALDAMWDAELVGAIMYTVAATLLFLSIGIDVFFASKRGLNISRLLAFVALPCLFIAAIAPAAPLYVRLLEITKYVHCNGAPSFNSMLNNIFGDVDAVAIFALFSAKLMPVLLAVPPMLARGAFLCLESVLLDEQRAEERAKAVGGEKNSLTGEEGVAAMSMRAVFVTAVVLAPLPTLLPMMAISQGSGDGIVDALIVCFFVFPVSIAVVMLFTKTMRGAVLSYFSVIGTYIAFVFLIFLRLIIKYHLKHQVLHELSEPILYIEAVAEIGVSAAVVSDVLYVHL